MSRIGPLFRRLRAEGRAAFVPYVTCGDPHPEVTPEILRRLEESGADLIELGVPFSDPMADGPVLQRAAERALRAGTTLGTALEVVRDFRRGSEVPIILFGYANPLFRHGWERIAADARVAGADGFLCVDLPPEEAGDLERPARREGLDLVYLLAPTSTPGRLRTVLRRARGFVYFVSIAGVTGARESLPEELEGLVAAVRRQTELPIGVGFGIAHPEQALAVARFSDAVIVGSALAREIEAASGNGDAVDRVARLAASLATAVREAR